MRSQRITQSLLEMLAIWAYRLLVVTAVLVSAVWLQHLAPHGDRATLWTAICLALGWWVVLAEVKRQQLRLLGGTPAKGELGRPIQVAGLLLIVAADLLGGGRGWLAGCYLAGLALWSWIRTSLWPQVQAEAEAARVARGAPPVPVLLTLPPRTAQCQTGPVAVPVPPVAAA